MAFTLEHSTIAKCKPEHIWKFFSNMEQWSWWNRVVGNCRWLNGQQPWQPGSRFILALERPRRMEVECRILECDPPGKVTWVGGGFGWRGEHHFVFEAQPDGTTLMKQWEDLSGFGTMLAGEGRKKQAMAAYEAWFEALKFEAERVAREDKARS